MSLLVLTVLFLGGCGTVENKSNQQTNLTATFELTDTAGDNTTTFQSGEPFLMFFSLTNTGADTIIYYSVGCRPAVIFQVLKNDSVVGTTPAGCDNVITPHFIALHDTLQGQWKVSAILTPGPYQAKVWYPNFDQVKGVNPVPKIPFSIIQ